MTRHGGSSDDPVEAALRAGGTVLFVYPHPAWRKVVHSRVMVELRRMALEPATVRANQIVLENGARIFSSCPADIPPSSMRGCRYDIVVIYYPEMLDASDRKLIHHLVSDESKIISWYG